MALPAHKMAAAGTIALPSAAGLVGHVLAEIPKGKSLVGTSTADIADSVLAALDRGHEPAQRAGPR
ncbi:hypothetical protein AB0D86_29640 [Streptomyces sp. NPDC048324]|uniref:hypothetical protein n=1 Tax=Streptomyces sp. NPDC048324 TaxID=3157205 RepID=UPI003433E014